MSDREEGFRAGVEAAAKVCDGVSEEHARAAGEALERGEVLLGYRQLTAARCAASIRALTPATDGAEALLREAREYVLAYEMGADTDKGRPGAKNLLARIDAHRKESGHDR